MGLLDNLQLGHGANFSGGLLDFLRTTQMQQQQYQPSAGFGPNPMDANNQMQAAPMDIGGYQMPRIGNAEQFAPQVTDFSAQSRQPQMQPQPMQAPEPPQQAGGLGAGLSGFLGNLHTGPLGAIIGGIGSAAGLQDPALAAGRQQANMTGAYLRKVGVPEEAIAAAVGNGRVPGNPEVLKTLLAKYGNQEKVRPATPEERKAFGAPDEVPMAIDTTSNKPIYGPAAQKNNVSLNTVANPVMTGVGKQIVDQRETAQTAARQTIPFVHEARQALDQGAITGQFADQKVFAQKVAGLFGLPTDSASNTEVFRSAVGNQVLAQIKALGANPSNADRDYIEKIQGGQVTLEEGSLRKLLDITEKYARSSIRNFNSDAQKLISAKPESYQDIAPLMQFDEPPAYSFKPSAATAPAAPTASGSGWQNLGNGVKIRPK